MATTHKFTTQQIELFNDRIQNCLNDATCRKEFEKYLKAIRDKLLLKTFKLWEHVHEAEMFEEERIYDLIDDVDGFNENPLLSIAEEQHKIDYIKSECCRLLDKKHKSFISYLRKYCCL